MPCVITTENKLWHFHTVSMEPFLAGCALYHLPPTVWHPTSTKDFDTFYFSCVFTRDQTSWLLQYFLGNNVASGK